MSLSWDAVFPCIAVYLILSLARDGMIVARMLYCAAAGYVPAAEGCAPAAAVATAQCKASTTSTPNQASARAKHLNVPSEIYLLPGNMANKKAMICHDMVDVFDYCKYFGFLDYVGKFMYFSLFFILGIDLLL